MSQTSESLLNEAFQATEAKKFSKAIELYRKVVDREPNHIAALQGMGLNYLFLGRFRESQRYLERAYSLNTRNLTTLILLVRLYSETDQTDASILALKRSIQLQEGNIANYIALGRQYGRATRFEEGIEILKRALKLAPNRKDVLADLGYLYLYNDDWNEAEKTFQTLLRLDPKNPDALSGLQKLRVYRRPVYISRVNAIEFKDDSIPDAKERQYQISQEFIYKLNQNVSLEGRYQKNDRFQNLEDTRQDYSFTQNIFSLKAWSQWKGGWSGAGRYEWNDFRGETGNIFDFEEDRISRSTAFVYLLYEQEKYYGMVSWTRGLYLQTLARPARLRMNRYFDYGATFGWHFSRYVESLVRYDYLDYTEQHDRHDAELRLLWAPKFLKKFEFSYGFGILTDPAAQLNMVSARFKDTIFSDVLIDLLYQTMLNNNKNDGGTTWSNTWSAFFSIPIYKEASLNLAASWTKEYLRDHDITQVYRAFIEIPFGVF